MKIINRIKDVQEQPQRRKRALLNPGRLMILGLLVIILLGALVLGMPISNRSGEWLSASDALLTSFSSVCVTGLLSVDVATTFTGFGQAVVLILIQVGGIGFMSIASLFFFLLRKKVSLRDRLAMQEAMNAESHGGIMRLMRDVLVFTFAFEAAGFLLLLPVFAGAGGGRGVFNALFLSVSAFCNSGIEVLGTAAMPFASLRGYSHNAYLGFVVMALNLIGGLGFAVISDMTDKKRFSKFSLHTKVVLITGLAVDLLAFVFFFAAEYSNPATLGGESFWFKAYASLFQAVSTRTSGFSIINQHALTDASKMVSSVLMVIGGAPASTAGGIKITTVAVLLLLALSDITGREEIVAGKHMLNRRTGYRAVTILLFGLTVYISACTALLLSQSFLPLDTIFETAAAFGVGLSTGITPMLTSFGKAVLMFTMFLIRVGPFTIGLALLKKNSASHFKYPEASIIIG